MATLGNFTSGQVLTAAELNAIADETSFTPVWTNITVGNGTNAGRYFRINNVILMQVQLIFGSTTSISAGGVLLDFPVTAADTYLDGSGGQIVCEDVTGSDYFGPTFRSSGTKIGINVWTTSLTYLAASAITSTVPFTWATGDRLIVTHWYEAA